MNKIYVASKALHRPMWRKYRDEMGAKIISRWIDVDDEYIGRSVPDMDYKKLWKECIEDVRTSEVMVLYAEEGEVLKGALIEVGAMIGDGGHVFVAGDCGAIRANGTWLAHPQVHDMTEYPLDFVIEYAAGWRNPHG